MQKNLGKIKSAEFGFGGYQDAQIGLTLELGGPNWGTVVFEGFWSAPPSDNAQWTAGDQSEKFAYVTRRIRDLLSDGKCLSVSDLVGLPVYAKFEEPGGKLKTWWLLTDVI